MPTVRPPPSSPPPPTRPSGSWNSEVLVNFGKDLGNDTYPMYAAYLYFTGPTYLSVWSEDVQAIVNSLTLPQ